METNTTAMTEEKRIEVAANRIFAYYLQIINIKKEQGSKSFIIDQVPNEETPMISLVHLEDKYDGRSAWRQKLGVLENNGWHTLGGSFRDMGVNQQNEWYIDIEKVFKMVAKLLSKKGIANYFESPADSDLVKESDRQYQTHTYKQLLVIVL